MELRFAALRALFRHASGTLSRFEKAFRRPLAPGNLDHATQRRLIDRFEEHTSAASFSPRTLSWRKNGALRLHESALLFGRKDDHSVLLVRIAERGENPAADPEVRMRHVRAFHCVRHAERKLAEIGRFHCGTRITSRYPEEERFLRGAQAASLPFSAACREDIAFAFAMIPNAAGKLPAAAGWQPALPETKPAQPLRNILPFWVASFTLAGL